MRRSTIVLSAAFASVTAIAACNNDEAPKGPGSIHVRASSSAAEPVYFQYGIAIDNGTPRTIFAMESDSFLVTGLAHGSHSVAVTGVPTNCSGGATQTVDLKGDDTARVTFALLCSRTTGDIRVTIVTTGADLDQDGYIVTVGGAPSAYGPVNGSTTMQFFPTGTYIVGLIDVASNCTASASQNAQVTAGGLTSVNFTVNCTAVGHVRVTGTASGADRDPDGIGISIDGATATQAVFGSTTRIDPGSHTWALSDVQANCTLSGAASGSFSVAAGDTVTINGSMSCSAIPQGTAGASITDPAGDTLSTSSKTLPSAHDIRAVSTRYTPGFLIVALRFAKTAISPVGDNPSGVYGYLDVDVDEKAITGVPPAINFFGGSASQGIEFSVGLFEADTSSVPAGRLSGSNFVDAGRIRAKFEADSVVLWIPLAKMNNDDGNVTITTVIGTYDRPTDIAPNSGLMTSHIPAGPTVAAQAMTSTAPEYRSIPGKKPMMRTTGTWRR